MRSGVVAQMKIVAPSQEGLVGARPEHQSTTFRLIVRVTETFISQAEAVRIGPERIEGVSKLGDSLGGFSSPHMIVLKDETSPQG